MVLRWLPVATNKALDRGVAADKGDSSIKMVCFISLNESERAARMPKDRCERASGCASDALGRAVTGSVALLQKSLPA